jgi:hypothetical protein
VAHLLLVVVAGLGFRVFGVDPTYCNNTLPNGVRFDPAENITRWLIKFAYPMIIMSCLNSSYINTTTPPDTPPPIELS